VSMRSWNSPTPVASATTEFIGAVLSLPKALRAEAVSTQVRCARS
jgi:hypothetical protein